METAFIKKTIEYILSTLSPESRIVDVTEIHGGEITKFSIKTEEPHLLLGEDGKTLMALNHLVKRIFEGQSVKENFKPLNFMVDVNDYQEKRIQDLKTKAVMMAERARFFKSSVELVPMNPYERMIVHSFFTNIPDIETESTGFGKDRRVVIKYVEQVI